MIFYLNLLAYFYIACCTTSPLNIIMDEHSFRFMIANNIYIDQLPRRCEAFSTEIQYPEYISDIFGTIIKVGSNFVKNIKEKNN